MKCKYILTGLFLFIGSVLYNTNVFAEDNVQVSDQQINAKLDQLYGSHDEYRAFFKILKEYIAQKDKTKIANLIKYPLIVQLDGKQVSIKTKAQFIKNYDAIITPKIEYIVSQQKFENMLATYRGMAFGNGEIWFANVLPDQSRHGKEKKLIKIIGINNFM
ncbi:hypothetical protein [Commensalibacter oyaizuii]|uniref:Uncharacterized protein n=1 Tax=Commensalibacter oyaizuii TaxID=3043873 RepID=A0ABT6Q1N3_9PROT|nr:hypothetical protein [Commensalibacter sp. TBRC 16381]MDI2091026.1 hypothetical protein [Commensalibacter sp. TBRC 16381]